MAFLLPGPRVYQVPLLPCHCHHFLRQVFVLLALLGVTLGFHPSRPKRCHALRPSEGMRRRQRRRQGRHLPRESTFYPAWLPSSRSLSLTRRVQQQLKQQGGDDGYVDDSSSSAASTKTSTTTSNTPDENSACRQFFVAFNEHVNRRVDQADNNNSSKFNNHVLYLDWKNGDIKSWYNVEDNQEAETNQPSAKEKIFTQEQRRSFLDGGFCIVKLHDNDNKNNTTSRDGDDDDYDLSLTSSPRQDLVDLWHVVKAFFYQVDESSSLSSSSSSSMTEDLRYQQLVRRKSNNNGNNNDKDDDKKSMSHAEKENKEQRRSKVGYNYIEIGSSNPPLSSMTPSEIVMMSSPSPSPLQQHLGESSAKVAQKSVITLQNIGQSLAARVVVELLGWPTKRAQVLMNRLVRGCSQNNGDTPTSFQRLARYMPARTDQAETENLSSHCDWSIFTIVPVSDVAGLQVFQPKSQTWVCVEEVARKHAVAMEATGSADSTRAYQTLPEYWNAGYLVVMTGKWLELLTNGRVESTFHRVVSPRESSQRYSAPFFLRLQLGVLERVEEVALEEPVNVGTSVEHLSRFLQQYGENDSK